MEFYVCLLIIGLLMVLAFNIDHDKRDLHKKIDRECDMESSHYRDGEITGECTVNALREIRIEMKTMLSETEKDALEYSADFIETMIEFMPTLQDICNADWRIQALVGISTAELERAIRQGDLMVITGDEYRRCRNQ